jgi:hypothetical protein
MSAREEALRLAREAGLFDVEEARDLTLEFEQAITRFVVLARQRPGWVWVPEDQTVEMIEAGKDERIRCFETKGRETNPVSVGEALGRIFRVMLAAAPKPEDI